MVLLLFGVAPQKVVSFRSGGGGGSGRTGFVAEGPVRWQSTENKFTTTNSITTRAPKAVLRPQSLLTLHSLNDSNDNGNTREGDDGVSHKNNHRRTTTTVATTTTTTTTTIWEQIRHFESLVETFGEQQQTELCNIQDSLQILLGNDDDNHVNDDGPEPTTTTTTTPDDDDDDDGIDPLGDDDPASSASLGGPEQIVSDVCIVGGGPAGCTCALFCARAGLTTILLDKNPALGALAITSHIVNYPGAIATSSTILDRAGGGDDDNENEDHRISGEGLLDRMRQQAIDSGADYRRAQVFMIDGMEHTTTSSSSATNEEDSDPEYTVYTPEAIIRSKTLVLATGAMGRVALPFPGEDTYLGMGVSYCATCDGAFYRDAEVAVKGISLEAMEEARFLTKFAKTVHWV